MRTLSRRDFFAPTSIDDAADPLVHIASLIVQVTPAGRANVQACIADIPAAELHPTSDPNKVAVLLEANDGHALAEATAMLQDLSGVLTVSVGAHFTERASQLRESAE